MPFRPTHARIHPAMGLELKEDDGPWMCADTKIVLLDAGIVSLVDASRQFTDRVEVPAGVLGVEPASIVGTTNPVALELARRKSRRELPYAEDGGYLEIPLPEY